MTTDFPDTRVCRQFFVVPNAGWSKRHGEMIRIDDERRDEWCSSSIFVCAPGTWCPKTEKQGLAGGEAPRPPGHGRRNVRDLVQRERRYKGRWDFVHQVGIGHGRKNAGDLVHRERRNKGWRDFVHQVGAGHGRRNARDLVQRERRYKGRRDFVHQVGAGHGRRNARDLVQRKLKNKGWRDFVHQVAPTPRPHHARRTPPAPLRPSPRPFMRKFINFRMIIKVY